MKTHLKSKLGANPTNEKLVKDMLEAFVVAETDYPYGDGMVGGIGDAKWNDGYKWWNEPKQHWGGWPRG